jgi:hypothetical protein
VVRISGWVGDQDGVEFEAFGLDDVEYGGGGVEDGRVVAMGNRIPLFCAIERSFHSWLPGKLEVLLRGRLDTWGDSAVPQEP